MPDYASFAFNLTDSIDSFELALGKRLALLDRVLQPIFQASLGINLEAPQPEADEVGGQPVRLWMYSALRDRLRNIPAQH